MPDMPNMLAFTIRSSLYSNNSPYAVVGQGHNGTWMSPMKPQDDSYWIAILSANNPRLVVKDWTVPGANNSTVPSGLDTFMADPANLFIVATQYLSTLHVPQGNFYTYLVKYGAGPELQKLEQINVVLSCGTYSRVSYILTGQCGPRGAGIIPPPSYEVGSYTKDAALLLMSLMPMPNGGPPWSICDCNTFMAMAKSTAPKSSAKALTAKKSSAQASTAKKGSAQSLTSKTRDANAPAAKKSSAKSTKGGSGRASKK